MVVISNKIQLRNASAGVTMKTAIARLIASVAHTLRELKLHSLALRLMRISSALGESVAEATVACWTWHSTHDSALEDSLRAGIPYFDSCRPDLAELLQMKGDGEGAIRLLTEGVDLGELMSFVPLANAVEESDPILAKELLMRASEFGDGHASHNLAIDYALASDFQLARHYGELAFKQGDKHARYFLQDLPT